MELFGQRNTNYQGLPRRPSGKESATQYRRHRRCRLDPLVRKIPWRREWQLTLVFLPGEFHGQRSLAGYSPWSCKESVMTEQLRIILITIDHTHQPETQIQTAAHFHMTTNKHYLYIFKWFLTSKENNISNR